ncbi:Small-conductance mechanosensitive channel [Thalassoglobus neptunius]|uniref:Small-conductance mechanosensitive channel n=1 Tax=Thalassoglobus neptunius TaxID=1938619 RepID=A0A5C5VQ59_9PLAN|nr:mechanosensitive ion channel family protein [Thalassoglobus neptunius]TWT40173.1 Small-conductance mechanosensitive channel [Thalassoglobus neptunius]
MKIRKIAISLGWIFCTALTSLAQDDVPDQFAADAEIEAVKSAPADVEVQPAVTDQMIEERLENILRATEWFLRPQVEVNEGVAFISGEAETDEHRKWAGDLARNTQDVVAVVNKLQVTPKSIWDFTPAWIEIQRMGREAVQATPLLLLGLLLFGLTWVFATMSMRIAFALFENRLPSPLLRHVISRAIAIPVFLFGIYLILRISGLTQIAMTVLGGTGLIGIVIGIAFRDIAENFLASILISIQRPFSLGDLIQVGGHEGVVQRVTTRGTLLMTLDGNHVQIPNATIYKNVIKNFTANPKRRFDFLVGIDYLDSASKAQDVIQQMLEDHEAILDDPEPMVLVEELGTSTVNLRVYAWIDGSQYSAAKVRSSVIRLTKRAISDAGLTMPDEAREVIFPNGIPVTMIDDQRRTRHPHEQESSTSVPAAEPETVQNESEGGFSSEIEEIEKQAQESSPPDKGANLLDTAEQE